MILNRILIVKLIEVIEEIYNIPIIVQLLFAFLLFNVYTICITRICIAIIFY